MKTLYNAEEINEVVSFKPQAAKLQGEAQQQKITENELKKANAEIGNVVVKLQTLTGSPRSRLTSIPIIGAKIKSNMKISAAQVGEDVLKTLSTHETTIKNIATDNLMMLSDSKDRVIELEKMISKGDRAIDNIFDIGAAHNLSSDDITQLRYKLEERVNAFKRILAYEEMNQTGLQTVTDAAKMVLSELDIAKVMVPNLVKAIDNTIKAEKIQHIHSTVKNVEEATNKLLLETIKKTANLQQDMKMDIIVKEENVNKTLEGVNKILEAKSLSILELKDPNSDFNKKLAALREVKDIQLAKLSENNKKLETLADEDVTALLTSLT